MDARPILVVDDTPQIRELIAETLANEGYAVECACNGAKALVAVERNRPFLILLDLHMPVLDGWGFARALADRSLHVPFIILTAARDPHHYARELGAVACVGKPFVLADLLDTVGEIYRTANSVSPASSNQGDSA